MEIRSTLSIVIYTALIFEPVCLSGSDTVTVRVTDCCIYIVCVPDIGDPPIEIEIVGGLFVISSGELGVVPIPTIYELIIFFPISILLSFQANTIPESIP